MSRSVHEPFCLFAAIIAAVSLLVGIPTASPGQEVAPEQYEQLDFRHIGPVGNRLISVAGIPGNRSVYYAGAASGGVWKTVDAGLSWEPVFDGQSAHSIGALAIAPSDPQIIWAGTGETFIRSNVSIGDGIYKSTDGGATWTRMGLENTGRVGRVIVHPRNPNIVYAAALGHGYSPQQERGIYRTTDGGATWEQVLFVDEETGASDLIMDPTNPRILFAGMWQLELRTWTRESGGPGSGIFMSRDGGDTWTRLEGEGLPELPVGKIALCTTPADEDRIYALIETGDGVPWHGEPTESGELWRSDDAGESWELVNHDRDLGGRSAYYSRCEVSTNDPDEVYFLAASFSKSLDGGVTSELIPRGDAPGWDHHDMWIDPLNGDRMAVVHDGGVAISENRGTSWLRVQLPVAQMYHVTVDNQIPYNVYGNRQDGPSMRGPSNSRTGDEIPRGMWHSVGGGESGFATPDTVDADVVWSSASGSGARGGIVVRYNERTRQFRQVEVWPESTGGWPAAELRYRFQWTFPVLISPHDNNAIYVTSQHVHRTTNGGQSWDVISPDLTTNDKSKQGISGGLTPDNIGVEYCCVIYAFDESPVQQGVFWAGTNDGLVHVSRDGGENWTDVTEAIPDLPPLGTVRNIDASKWDPGKAYLTVDFHEVGVFEPFVYKTEDFGESWTRITDGIAASPLSYARNVREDPVRPGLLYLGTENALYASFDDGANWQLLGGGGADALPSAPMYWIEVQEHFNDLVIGTYGRGFWILDDLTPLQQLTPDVAGADAHLFAPRSAYRFHEITEPMAMFDDPSAGENPPEGASINYWLGTVPTGDVTLRIENGSGETIRTLEGTKEAGINRVWWDLESEPSTEITMRTKPLFADWVDLGDERARSAGGRISILEPPGTYTVVLEVDGNEVRQPLEILKDPSSEGDIADIEAQTAMLRELQSDLNAAADMINRIEWIRRQVQDLEPLLEEGDDDGVTDAAAELGDKLVAVESNLIQLRLTGTGQDGVRWPAMLVERISYLAGTVATADFPPTDQAGEVHEVLRQQLRQYEGELNEILENDLPAFNRTLQEWNAGPVIAVTP